MSTITDLDGTERLVSYDDVNKAWGIPCVLPPITAKEAGKFYLKLRRHFGYPFKGRRGINPRRVWAAPKGTTHPLGRGWPRMVHDASHRVFSHLHPTLKTHSAAHAALELEMIRYCLAQGWTTPKAMPAKPSTTDRRAADLARTQAAIKLWETKAKRAATALRKLRQKERRLARVLQTAA